MTTPLDRILTARLVERHNPFQILGLADQCDWLKYPPRKQYSEDRDERYDLGRIRFFVEQYETNQPVDPIYVDNLTWAGKIILPEPVVIDGHHRLCGAVLAQKKWLDIVYGGRVDVLRWLKGKRKLLPDQ
jgi:hypothetical protein